MSWLANAEGFLLGEFPTPPELRAGGDLLRLPIMGSGGLNESRDRVAHSQHLQLDMGRGGNSQHGDCA